MTGPHADKTKPRDRRLGVLLIIAGIIYYGVIAMFCSRRSAAMRFRRNAFLRFDDLLRGDAEAQMFGNVEELYGLGDRAGLIRRRDGAEISGGSAAREADTPAEQNAVSCRKPRANINRLMGMQ